MRLILLPFLSGLWISGLAQNLINLHATQQGNEVLVNYDLEGESGRAYMVNLYASTNNFSSPLKLVEGDVLAKRVLPGTTKTIKWNALEELKNFDGNISFEIRAKIIPSLFSKITASSSKVKRGKEVTINWTGGNSQEQVVVELIKGRKHVTASTLPNQGKLQYTIPGKMKTGKYSIQLSQAGEWSIAEGFAVKPIVPLAIKILPAVVVGGVLTFWPDPDTKFPGPPNLTGN